MHVVVVFGPPGVGKGTQCSLLAQRLGVFHVSTGSLLRAEITLGSSLGQKVQEIVKAGRLVGDDTLFSCLREELKRRSGEEGVLLLDGVPRNVAQVVGLDKILAEFGLQVEKVVNLTADVTRLVERFASRWTCKCGQVTSIKNFDDVSQSVCTCGLSGKFTRRDDDKPEVVQDRMRIYESETRPVINEYLNRNIILNADGLEDIETVYSKVSKEIDILKNGA